MSTVDEPLKYLWTAWFVDAHMIEQPANDQYSKHIEGAEHNPSAFRDVLDYERVSPIKWFALEGAGKWYSIDLCSGLFAATSDDGTEAHFSLEDTPLSNRKLIFFRQVQMQTIDGVPQPPKVARYCLGYEGKNAEGKVEKKVIYIE